MASVSDKPAQGVRRGRHRSGDVAEWRDVWVGAVVTALLFTLGRLIIGTYTGTHIGKSGVASAFGAESTWVYAKTFGSMRHLAQDEVPKTAALTPATGSPTGEPNMAI